MFIHSTHLINMTDTRSFLIFLGGFIVWSIYIYHIIIYDVYIIYDMFFLQDVGGEFGEFGETSQLQRVAGIPPTFPRPSREKVETIAASEDIDEKEEIRNATKPPWYPWHLRTCASLVKHPWVFTCSSEICQRLRCLFGREFVLSFSLWGWDIIENHGKNHQYEKLRSGSSDSSSFFWGEWIISSPWPYCCVFFVPRSLKSNLGLGAHPLSGDLSCGMLWDWFKIAPETSAFCLTCFQGPSVEILVVHGMEENMPCMKEFWLAVSNFHFGRSRQSARPKPCLKNSRTLTVWLQETAEPAGIAQLVQAGFQYRFLSLPMLIEYIYSWSKLAWFVNYPVADWKQCRRNVFCSDI